MTHYIKHFISMLCVFVTVFCGASAAQTEQAKTYYARIVVEGNLVICLNQQQDLVPILEYNETNYIPVRTAGEWLGKTVSWDETTQTVTLSGSGIPVYQDFYKEKNKTWGFEYGGTVTTKIQPELKIVMDGKPYSFKNQRGETVYPLSYCGTTYLPLRNIGELCGMEISWRNADDSANECPTFFLRTPLTTVQKTACENYLNALKLIDDKLSTASVNLLDSAKPRKEQLIAITAALNEMKQLQLPKEALLLNRRHEILLEEIVGLESIAEQASKSSEYHKLITETSFITTEISTMEFYYTQSGMKT